MALRYVILRHEGVETPHFDLMFETSEGAGLSTWRSDVWPIFDLTPLTKLRDHRREFLTFNGLLSGNRGAVTQIESGDCDRTMTADGIWQMSLHSDHAITVLWLLPGNTPADPWTARRI